MGEIGRVCCRRSIEKQEGQMQGACGQVYAG